MSERRAVERRRRRSNGRFTLPRNDRKLTDSEFELGTGISNNVPTIERDDDPAAARLIRHNLNGGV